MRDTCEIAVIGGGLAGSAAAITLVRGGRDVVLLEAQPGAVHKVCGEFLSAEALDDIAALGVDVGAMGALPIRRVRLASQRGVREATLPFPAMSITRRTLDEALLRTAVEAGAEVQRPCRVVSVDRIEESDQARRVWGIRTLDGSTLRAREVVIAAGKHDLPGRPRPAGSQRGMLGLKTYYRLAPEQAAALDGSVELCVYPGGYGGLQPVEDGAANLCCVIRKDEFQRLGGRADAMLETLRRICPHLDLRLGQAKPMLDRALAIAPIPYGFVRRHTDGPWYVGDQAAVIPSFTGDGMSIALHSGRLGAAMLLEGRTAEQFTQQLHTDVARQVHIATWLARGLLHPVLGAPMLRIAEAWPGILQVVATGTRVSPKVRDSRRVVRAA